MSALFSLFPLFILLTATNLGAAIMPESVSVSPHQRPGTTDLTQLSAPGFQFHEFNDYFGDTDKLITGGAKIKAKGLWPHFSASFALGGAYIMPVYKTRSDQEPLEDLVGIHAETFESDLDIAYTFYGGIDSLFALRMDLGLGFFKLDEYGMVNIYRDVHQAIGSPILDDKFGEKRKEEFYASNYGLTLVVGLTDFLNLNLGASVYNSTAFYEYSYDATLLLRVNVDYALSLKYSFIDHKSSEWWNLKTNRHQFLAGLRLFQYWTPSIMYISSYVEGDEFGQTYLSPVSFTIPWD